MTVEEFWRNVDKSRKCWIWRKCLDNNEYGVARVGEMRLMKTHQISWLLNGNRQWRAGEVLYHTCRNKACVNPSHLGIASMRDLVRETFPAMADGRSPVDESAGKNESLLLPV